jgi:signal transduction histidine kinase
MTDRPLHLPVRDVRQVHPHRLTARDLQGAGPHLFADGPIAVAVEEHRRQIEGAIWRELRLLRQLTEQQSRRPQDAHASSVREVVDRQARLAVLRGMPVSVDISGDPRSTMPAATLEEVILNLLLNAERHAGGAEVEMTVRSAEQPSRLELTVADRGPGPTRDAHTAGSGIGLRVSRRLVRAAGGRLELRARPGGGAIAIIDLPAAGAATAEGSDPIDREPEDALSRPSS